MRDPDTLNLQACLGHLYVKSDYRIIPTQLKIANDPILLFLLSDFVLDIIAFLHLLARINRHEEAKTN